MKHPKVKDVNASEDYTIIFTSEDGTVRRFDVKPYIRGSWYGKLRNPDVFCTVRPCGNTVVWEGGQDVAPHELYELSSVIV